MTAYPERYVGQLVRVHGQTWRVAWEAPWADMVTLERFPRFSDSTRTSRLEKWVRCKPAGRLARIWYWLANDDREYRENADGFSDEIRQADEYHRSVFAPPPWRREPQDAAPSPAADTGGQR